MSKKNDIKTILGVSTHEQVVNILNYKLSPNQPLTETEIDMIINLCENYQINPAFGMLYLRRDLENNTIYPTLKVDGWYKLVNDQPDCNGYEFIESESVIPVPNSTNPDLRCFESIGCKIYRKGRDHTPIIYEYINECFNPFNSAYATHPNRLLRHSAFIQAARVVYNLSGLSDPNESIEKNEVNIDNFEVVGDLSLSADNTKENSIEESTDDSFEDLSQTEEQLPKTEDIPNETLDIDVSIVNQKQASTVKDKSNQNVINECVEPEPFVATQIKCYLKRAYDTNQLDDCVHFLKGNHDVEFHPYILKIKDELLAA